jgi:peptidoglycan/xylan/chitin deacetylase (PgdA/CDA1 family)
MATSTVAGQAGAGMTLLVLMFHRAQAGRYGNSVQSLEAHFAHLARACNCVLPGDPLDRRRLNVCLSFDDAYYDFFAFVPPLLEKHDLRALLAVPPGMIQERTAASHGARLALSVGDTAAHPEGGGLCTWPELESLAATGRVAFAAHGRSHIRLDEDGVDLQREVVVPHLELEQRLHLPVESFVYPFGRFDRTVHALARQSYRYVFRIGAASNASWEAPLLYRVDGDRMASPTVLLSPLRRLRYRWNAGWNRLRGV